MTIEYLHLLQQYLTGPGIPPIGMTETEILALQTEFCANGKPFPKTLKEFLFLTGKQCAHFDSGVGSSPTYNTVQQKRLTIIANLPYSFSYPNIWSFGYQTDTESFYFIDLNEDSDDPDVYYTWLYEKQDRTGIPGECIEKTQYTFSGFIEASINYYLATNDPFPH